MLCCCMGSVGVPINSHSQLHFIKLKRSMPNSVYMERASSTFILHNISEQIEMLSVCTLCDIPNYQITNSSIVSSLHTSYSRIPCSLLILEIDHIVWRSRMKLV